MKQATAVLSAILLTGCSSSTSGGSSEKVAFSETTDPVKNSTIVSGTTYTSNPENTLRGMLRLSCELPEKTLTLVVGSYAAVAGAGDAYPGAEINFGTFEQRWGNVTSQDLQTVLANFATFDFTNEPNIQLTRVFRAIIADQQRLDRTVANYDAGLALLDTLLQKKRPLDSLNLAIDALPSAEARAVREAIRLVFVWGRTPERAAEEGIPRDIRTPALDAMVSQAINLEAGFKETSRELERRIDPIPEFAGYNFQPEYYQSISDQARSSRASSQEELNQHRAKWGTFTTDTDPNSLMRSLGDDWAFSFAATGGRISMTMDVASMQRVVDACLMR